MPIETFHPPSVMGPGCATIHPNLVCLCRSDSEDGQVVCAARLCRLRSVLFPRFRGQIRSALTSYPKDKPALIFERAVLLQRFPRKHPRLSILSRSPGCAKASAAHHVDRSGVEITASSCTAPECLPSGTANRPPRGVEEEGCPRRDETSRALAGAKPARGHRAVHARSLYAGVCKQSIRINKEVESPVRRGALRDPRIIATSTLSSQEVGALVK